MENRPVKRVDLHWEGNGGNTSFHQLGFARFTLHSPTDLTSKSETLRGARVHGLVPSLDCGVGREEKGDTEMGSAANMAHRLTVEWSAANQSK